MMNIKTQFLTISRFSGFEDASIASETEDSRKIRRNLPVRKAASTQKSQVSPKSSKSNGKSVHAEDEHSRDSLDGKVMKTSGTSHLATRMPDIVQRRCKNVVSKLQRRIDKEGQQIVPLLTDLWKRLEKQPHLLGHDLLDLRRIDHRVERLEYDGVMGLVLDVQFMLKGAMQFYGCSAEAEIVFKSLIAMDIVGLLQELADEDMLEDNDKPAQTLVQNLNRLPDTDPD